MKKFIAVAAALAVLAVIVIVVFPFTKRKVPFRFVYSARNWGNLLPLEETKFGRYLGGYDRRSTVVKEMSRAPRSFVVDSGGFFPHPVAGTLAYREVLARFTLKGMERTGVEISNIDIMDQMWGREKLLEYTSSVSFPFVSASLVDAETGEYVYEPFRVIEKDGLRVAFVGVVETGPIANRRGREAVARARLMPGMEEPDFSNMPDEGEGLRVLTPYEALDRVAPLVKGKAHVVVLLAAGGDEIWNALRKFRDGRTFHMALGVTGKAAEEPNMQGKVPVFMTGLGNTYVAVVDGVWMEDGTVKYTRWDPIPLTEDIPPDPALVGLPTEMRRSLADIDPKLLVNKIYGPQGEEKYVGAQACARCHRAEYEIWSGGPHAHALDLLKAEDAQYDPKCIGCHVTDYQAVDGYVSEEETPELAPITCELCHGRGSIHVELGGRGADAALVNPDPPRCIICHDYVNDPEFDYEKDWLKIQHGRGREPVGEAVPSGKGRHP